jgi:hypothetical protein
MSRELFRLVGVWSGCWVVRDADICYGETLHFNDALLRVCDVCIDRGGQQFEHFQLLIVTSC